MRDISNEQKQRRPRSGVQEIIGMIKISNQGGVKSQMFYSLCKNKLKFYHLLQIYTNDIKLSIHVF